MKTEKEYYEIDVRCDNCNHQEKVKIKKGILVTSVLSWWRSYLKNKKCENCGCEMLLLTRGEKRINI